MKLNRSIHLIAAVTAIFGLAVASGGQARIALAGGLPAHLQSELGGSTVQYWADYDGNGIVGSPGDTLLASTTTDVNGNYEFTNVVAPRPQVLGLIVHLSPASPPIVPNPGGKWDLGGGGNPLPIFGKLFLDTDGNGRIDPAADALLDTTTVDANGAYQFHNSTLVPGGATIGIVFNYAQPCLMCMVPNPRGGTDIL